MQTLAPGSLLAQVRPANTTATAGLTAAMQTEVRRIFVCNNTGSAVAFRLHHDVGGSTYDQSNALYYDKTVPANDSIVIESDAGGGIGLAESDTLGVRTATGDALTFSFYGYTARGR